MRHNKWYFIVLFTVIFFTGCNNEDEERHYEPATIEEPTLSAVSTISLRLVATISNTGGAEIIEKGFCWSISKEMPDIKDNFIEITDGSDQIEGEIDGLTPNTKYYIRAFAVNSAGIAYSPTSIVATNEEGEIIIGSSELTEITHNTATAVSSVTNTTTRNIISFGFIYSPDTATPLDDVFTIEAEGTIDEFTSILTNLESETLYFIQPYIKTEEITLYGEVQSFKTEVDKKGILNNFFGPNYLDDYSDCIETISCFNSWGHRIHWGLANVLDPSVEKCGNYYYMYSTDASYDDLHTYGEGNLFYRRSTDLVNWEFLGMVIPETPLWIKDSLNSMRSRAGLSPIDNPIYKYRAPVVRKAGNKYRMYYSIHIDNYILTGKPNTADNFDHSWNERAFIGLMETHDLGGNVWEDKGMVLSSFTDKGTNWSRDNVNDVDAYYKWNATDPSFIINLESEHWLVYGSWHSGIVALQLNPETGKPYQLGESSDKNNQENYGQPIYSRSPGSRWQGSEAPEVIYNEQTGYYYLFLAYDESNVAYNTRVCRADHIYGPYYDFTGNNVTQNGGDIYPVITHPYKFDNHSGWVGLSHTSIIRDDDGNWFYCSHARLPENTNRNSRSNEIMMGHIRKMRWTTDGWPVVMPERYAGVPEVEIDESDLIGSWELIFLDYQSGRQQTSVKLTLNADNTTNGALNDKWSYNIETKELSIGNQILFIEREVNWEAVSSKLRKPTLVFAGLNNSGISLWGKKVD